MPEVAVGSSGTLADVRDRDGETKERGLIFVKQEESDEPLYGKRKFAETKFIFR